MKIIDTLNKVLLRRQPKLCDVFLLFSRYLVSLKLISFYLVLLLIRFCLFDPGLSVFSLKFKDFGSPKVGTLTRKFGELKSK